MKTSETQRLIDRLHKAARNARNAKNPAQHEAAVAFLVTRADELRAVRDRLDVKLERQWEILDRMSPDDDRYERRTAVAIATLHEYEAVCDALDAALVEWLHEEAA